MFIRTMTIIFDLPISSSQLKLFRGAIIARAGRELTMFHNHAQQGFVYAYPLIQYRRAGANAAILCINDGIEQMQQLFAKGLVGSTISIGGKEEVPLSLLRVQQSKFNVDVVEDMIEYRIANWLPLNQSNYNIFSNLQSAEEQTAMLNRLLIANIISFAKNIGWHIVQRIECQIEPQSITSQVNIYKQQRFVSFSLQFKCNVLLPPKIGLGKGVSLNHGVVTMTPQLEEQ